MFKFFELKGSEIIKGAVIEQKKMGHLFVGTEHLMLSILKNDEDCSNILKKYGISYKEFKDYVIMINPSSEVKKTSSFSPLLKSVILGTISMNKSDDMFGKCLLKTILECEEGIAYKLLLSCDVDMDLLINDINNSIGDSLNVLNNIAVNLTNKTSDNNLLIGREDEINQIMEILIRKDKNNPLLIGEAGVGKTAIIEELARRVKNGEVPGILKNKIIYKLEMGSLVSGTKYRGEFEEKLNNIIKEVTKNNDIILFIDEIHTIINAGGAEGAINASNMLKPYLARSGVKIIGATTLNEYEKYIKLDKAFDRRFEKIMISEPTKEQLKNILYGVREEYEKYHNLHISNFVLDNILKLNDCYITKNCNPDKSLDILDTLCAHIVLKNNSLIIKDKEYANKIKKAITKMDYVTANKLFLDLKSNKFFDGKITIDDIRYIIEKKNRVVNKKSKPIGFAS